jgi:tartrate dehydrogenase/decarboxylase/D-malate dehydrogenase
MATYRIALYPGDGIGVDVIHEAHRALDAVGFDAQYETLGWGCDYHDKHGRVMPEDYLAQLKTFDAILLGAVGYPEKLPDHVTLEPLVGTRQAFDQFACVRPTKLRPGVRSLLNERVVKDGIDMIVVRENSEGEYFTCGGRFKQGRDEEIAVQTAIHSRKGIERILRFGFELARTRPRKKMTMITKSNAMRFSMVLWDEVLEDLKPQYSDIECDRQHIDAAAMNFVRRPGHFDVVVASNLFGDILTDLSGALVGSLGLNPSANLDPSRVNPSLFEPVHGSAPDIVGKNLANPVGAVLSAAMMLDWLGEKDAAKRMEAAVDQALADGCTTPDLGGNLGTDTMTDAIIQRLA